ncbi:hypothetical protein MUN81_21490 [Hymenobacter sp. 5317J-9]|uniref:hypothetical protein n=1 Tax=Hymenobacter sp. 5317J-9 TaxID=2932250 RepID=UPI001FD6CDA1|nr:hypothetical protein [Hymenobacter sp. 5317J-9]UOQ97787.1 hypothetical protein MUN81_21490 [Hymenobacter sp. 5317J-9]
MTTPEEYRPLAAGPAQPSSQPPQPETPQPPRFTDWISYGVAVIQQAAPTAADFTPAGG